MFQAFLDNKGTVCTYHILRGKMASAENITKALHTFQKGLKEKMSELRGGELLSQWANANSHLIMALKDLWAQQSIQMIDHLSYSSCLVKADFFLLPKIKNELIGISIT
jgi:hypothetical protein